MAQESFKVADFSGGITDDYLDGPANKSHVMDNLLLDRRGKPFVRDGSQNYRVQTAQGAVRIGRIFECEGQIFSIQAGRLYRGNNISAEIVGQSITYTTGSGKYLFVGDTDDAFTNVAQWNGHVYFTSSAALAPTGFAKPKVMYEADGVNAWRMRTAGLPAIAGGWGPSFETKTVPGGVVTAGAVNYTYAFHYQREYALSDGRTFIEAGPVTYHEFIGDETIVNGSMHGYLTTSGGGLGWPYPGGTSSTEQFYETTSAVIYIMIYRIPQLGGEPRYVGRVEAGSLVLTVTDAIADADLAGEIYTAGDIVEYDPPPSCKYVVIVNDIAWYANIAETGTVFTPQRVRQSLQSAPDKCPEEFFTDVDAPITGMGAVGNFPIVFCADRMYRLEGYVDNLGSGFVRKIVISDTIGCISADSITQSQRGVCFAAADGFYFTDGFNVQKVSGNINRTRYPIVAGGDATSKLRIYGAYDKRNDRYWWTAMSASDDTDNTVCYVFDASFGVREDGTFTTVSGDWGPTALCFASDGTMYRGTADGYLARHSSGQYADAVPDQSYTTAIMYDLQSCAFSFGDDSVAKYVTSMQATLRNGTSDLTMQIQSCNNDKATWSDLKIVRLRDETGALIVERRFPAGGLRCIYKQIRFSNGYGVLWSSSLPEGEGKRVTIGMSLALATLTDLAGMSGLVSWPTGYQNFIFHKIHLSHDDYAVGHTINTATSTQLGITNNGGLTQGTLREWEIRGYAKDERFSLESYIIYFERFGNTQQGYQAGDDAANA